MPGRSGGGRLTGTGALTRLALRRDRLMIPAWVAAVGLLAVATAASFGDLYPTPGSRLLFARSVEANAGLLALTGRVFEPGTIGGLTGWRISGTGALLTAIMSLLLVTRHTRAEEEAGRLELLGSGVVGRYAPLTAGLLTAGLANAGVGLLTAVALTAFGLPATGSVALGLGFAGTGVTFAAVAAVVAQLTGSARTANGIASAVAGLAFLLRAAGDSGDAHWLSWVSPIGWSQQVRPFAAERWWVLLMAAGVAGLLVATAYGLAGRRDLGAGVLANRPGRVRASRQLGSATALAWRLQRGSLIGWSAGFAVLGAAVGGLAGSVPELGESSPQLREALQRLGGSHSLTDAFVSTAFSFAGFAAAAWAVQAVLRLAGEESAGRAEPVLAAPVGRVRWALGHVVIAFAGVAVLLAVTGLAAGLTAGVRIGDVGGQLPRVLGAAMVQVFATWVLAGLVTALFGLAPRWAAAGWASLMVALLLSFVGALLSLNHWVTDVSPFTHLPSLPGPGDLDWTPLAWLTATSAVLVAVGLAALRRRDLR